MMNLKSNVLFLGNNTMLTEGLVSLMKYEESIELTVISMEELLILPKEKLKKFTIFVFTIDFQSKESKGILKQIKSSGISKILYSTNFSNGCFQNVVKYKINGYITLNDSFKDFLFGIQLLKTQETFYSQDVLHQLNLLNAIPTTNTRSKVKSQFNISKRELEIVRYIQKGFQSKQIGEALGISDRTVGKHRENIMKKCNVSNVTELLYFIQKNEIAI